MRLNMTILILALDSILIIGISNRILKTAINNIYIYILQDSDTYYGIPRCVTYVSRYLNYDYAITLRLLILVRTILH